MLNRVPHKRLEEIPHEVWKDLFLTRTILKRGGAWPRQDFLSFKVKSILKLFMLSLLVMLIIVLHIDLF